MNGTVEQAVAQLTLANPDRESHFGVTSNTILNKRWYGDWAADANCNNPPFNWKRAATLDL
jgi:hypothetical protein